MSFNLKKSTFSERMANIKAIFKTAHESANNLHAEIEEEITKKESQITILQEEIKTINITKQEAETFMSNIEKLI